MKKILCLTLSALLLLSLCACAKKEEPKAPEESQPVGAGLVNPLAQVSEADMLIPVNVPEGATDVQYFTITSGDSVTYETRFTLDGKKLYTRTEMTGELEPYDFSGLNYSFTTSDTEISGRPAKLYLCDTCGFIAFVDVVPGVGYNICSQDPIDADTLTALAEACFKPLQGEVG